MLLLSKFTYGFGNSVFHGLANQEVTNLLNEENCAPGKQEADDHGTDSVRDEKARLIQSHSYERCGTS